VNAVAAGAQPDRTPVIISGGDDGTVRVWRLADGTPLVPLWTYLNRYGLLPSTATSSSLRPGRTLPSTGSIPATHGLAAVLSGNNTAVK